MKRYRPTYSQWDILLADPVNPMSPEKRRHQLTRMHIGLSALEHDAAPTADDWRLMSDCVNLTETLVNMGHLQDDTGLLRDAIKGLAVSGARHVDEGLPLRLDGRGLNALRTVLASYTEAIETLPERVMVQAHARTERRIADMLLRGKRSGDVVVEVS